MTHRTGRPRKEAATARIQFLEVRVQAAEKQAFKDAADLAGLPLSAWIRERLRVAARQELAETGKPVAFMD